MLLKKSDRRSRAPLLRREVNLTFALIATANKLVAGASASYKRHFGIGIMEWRVLALLAAEPGITSKTIGIASGIDKAAVSRAAAALKRRGYLVSVRDEFDNRASRLALSRAGKNLHNKVIKISLERERLLSLGLTQKEHDQLLDFLHRLEQNVPVVSACVPDDNLGASRTPGNAGR